MNRLFLDFESYWSDTFTLRKMTPIQYILDPQYESFGCAFIHDHATKGTWQEWIDGPDLPEYFRTIDWPNTMAISHNAAFDMLILAMRYGIVPGFYGDTLSMARNKLSPALSSVSLESICEYYGMKAKWGTANKFKGMNLAMIKAQPWLYKEMCNYALDDAKKCRVIFEKLLMDENFPPNELRVIDMVIRMVTVPKFELDNNVLAEHLAKVKAEKDQLLAEAKLDKDTLYSIMSDPQLAQKLLHLGVMPPMKISKKTGKEAYAFAKTDREFTDLLEHEKPMVQALVAARLGHKSTLEETRTERLLAISRCTPKLPVPLKYSGAHTHRFSGDWKINLQNLPRGGNLRRAMRAPKGKKVIAVDASQIEARINAVLSNEAALIEAFRKGHDVYSEFASDIYAKPVNKQEFPNERQVGKVGILSLGYGASWPVFQAMVRNQAGINLNDREAATVVNVYRTKYAKIAANWRYANDIVLPNISGMADLSRELAQSMGQMEVSDWNAWGPIGLKRQTLVLPNDNEIRYRDLHRVFEAGWKWQFMRGKVVQTIYGAKVVENVTQALAFIHIMEVALRVLDLTNGQLWPAHQNHDELVYIEDDADAELVRDLVVQEMSRAPSWLPHAPLAAEGHVGQTWYEAK